MVIKLDRSMIQLFHLLHRLFVHVNQLTTSTTVSSSIVTTVTVSSTVIIKSTTISSATSHVASVVWKEIGSSYIACYSKCFSVQFFLCFPIWFINFSFTSFYSFTRDCVKEWFCFIVINRSWLVIWSAALVRIGWRSFTFSGFIYNFSVFGITVVLCYNILFFCGYIFF